MIDVALLGCGGMMPLPDRFLTSMLLRLNGRMLLVDCGEGTQVTMKMQGWGFKNIDVILFTHFHADHIAGLPGLLLTIGNSMRTEPLVIAGPKGISTIVKCLMVIAPELLFPIRFVELGGSGHFEIGDFSISALPVKHGMPCFAYSIDVSRRGKFDPEKAKKLDLPKNYWSRLQRDETVEYDGRIFTPAMVMGPPRQGIKVSYATDTRPIKALADFARDSDLFICEGIYGEDEKKEKAIEYKHMLFSEAAELARMAQAKKLWLTHYSPSLTRPQDFLHVARVIFPNTELGHDRKTTVISFPEE